MAFNYYSLTYTIPVVTLVVVLGLFFLFFPLGNVHSPSPSPTLYTVTFTQNGLPSGMVWNISFDGKVYWSSNSDPLHITVSGITAGSHVWSTQPLSCGTGCIYSPLVSTGQISTPGQSAVVVSFVRQYEVEVIPVFYYGYPSSSPSFVYLSLGSVNTKPLTSPFTVWADSGSSWFLSPGNIYSNSGNERWVTSFTKGQMENSETLNLVYYHQVLVDLNVSTSDGSIIPPLNVTYQSFGSLTYTKLSVGRGQYWMDVGSTLTATKAIYTNMNAERWMLKGPSIYSISGAITFNFLYDHQYLVSFYAYPSNAGTVNETTGWYSPGSMIVNALPTSGYTFEDWSSNGSGIFIRNQFSSLTQIVIHGPGNVTAKFVPSQSSFGFSLSTQSVTLTLVSGNGGTINYDVNNGQLIGTVSAGRPVAKVLPIGSYVCLTAIPAQGYGFKGWNNSVLSMANPFCFTLNHDTLVLAGFSLSSSGSGSGQGSNPPTQSVPEFPDGGFTLMVALSLFLVFFLSKHGEKVTAAKQTL